MRNRIFLDPLSPPSWGGFQLEAMGDLEARLHLQNLTASFNIAIPAGTVVCNMKQENKTQWTYTPAGYVSGDAISA